MTGITPEIFRPNHNIIGIKSQMFCLKNKIQNTNSILLFQREVSLNICYINTHTLYINIFYHIKHQNKKQNFILIADKIYKKADLNIV